MFPRRLESRRGWLALALVLLAGCGGPGAGAKPAATATATLSQGQQVLQRARAANLTDATFTLTAHLTGTATQGTLISTGPSTSTGHGTLTMDPRRIQVAYRLVSDSTPAAFTPGDFESILDYVTTTEYNKPSQWNPGTDMWDRLPGTGSQWAIPASVLAYWQLTDATLVATEQVAGVAVWHIRGALANKYGPVTVDAYLARDTYLPVQETLHLTLLDKDQEDDAYVFTAVNTGVTIALPLPDQVS